jgi:hypothetical protein
MTRPSINGKDSVVEGEIEEDLFNAPLIHPGSPKGKKRALSFDASFENPKANASVDFD